MLRLDPLKTGLVNIDLYAKLEYLNPFGSIKDRTAWASQTSRIGSSYLRHRLSGSRRR
jgi:hypothetical protein